MTPPSRSRELIGDSPVLLSSGNAIGCIESGEDELDTGGSNGCIAGGIDFECFLPGGGDTFQAFDVGTGGEHVSDFDANLFGEDFGALLQAVGIDVLFEYPLDGFRLNGVEDLAFGHLMGTHQIEF